MILNWGVEGSQAGGVGERVVMVIEAKGFEESFVRYSTNRFPRILVPFTMGKFESKVR